VRLHKLGMLGILFALLLMACGGGNGGNPPSGGGGTTGGSGPTGGEYLFQGNGLASLNLSTIDSSTGTLSAPVLAGSPGDDSSSYPGVAVTPSNKFLYALYSSFTVLEGFTISGPGLHLTLLPDAPFFPASQGPFNSLTLHPNGSFVYVIESPATIEEFSVNATSGDLTHASAVTELADLRVAAIDPTGRFLYANDLTGGRIFAYQINESDGSLTAVAGSPFTVPASGQPTLDVIDGTGKFLYAPLISGGVAAFALNISSGALTNVPGSPFPTSNQPDFIAADPAGGFIYVSNALNGVIDGFAIDAGIGALTGVVGSPFSTASSAGVIAVDPLGKFVYVTSYADSRIYGFSLDSSTGGLSPLTGSPFPAVPNPTNLYVVSIQ